MIENLIQKEKKNVEMFNKVPGIPTCWLLDMHENQFWSGSWLCKADS